MIETAFTLDSLALLTMLIVPAIPLIISISLDLAQKIPHKSRKTAQEGEDREAK